jgi:hypothetical protein
VRSKKARASCDDGGRHLADATQASGPLPQASQRIYGREPVLRGDTVLIVRQAPNQC